MSSLPSTSSSSSSISGHKYDVFLSFRGEDTRKKFTDHLYAALKRKGIVTFRDDPDLKRGEEIAPDLLKAIQESWCSVIVLSETYAFSGWCLEELAEIVKQKKERGHKVFPIFYEVDPSALRKQTGKLEEAFASHEEKYKEDKEKIQRWRTALTEVTNIAGWDSKDSHESEFIVDIVEKIHSAIPLQLIGPIFHSKDFMPSKATNLTFSHIIKALNTNGVNMIGLYGMPGVGKTTLVKEVWKQAKEQKLFDYVMMVTMSQTPDINKIQDRIAESLHFKFEASTEEGKAEVLWQRLKVLNKILIIIDDVWKAFELLTIGIPFGVEHKDCKILLTTRVERVCVQMNCHEKFQLKELSKEEAWALFKDKADLKDVSSTLNNVAEEVASECKGLPLAIVTVGTALKGASLDEWRAANQRFKDSRHLDNEDVCEGLYNRLQLSYDYLKGDNIQSCFLLCSLFPEDFDIGFESLLMLGIGFGLFANVYFFEELRAEICATVEKLRESGLLLEANDDFNAGVYNERYERMHDVIRDFAHWKTLKEGRIFMVKEGLKEWPRESFKCCTAISLWKNDINNFPANLKFPKLKFFVFGANNLVKIPSAFIEAMKSLRALRLQRVVFSVEALKFMKNLRTLCFEHCELENISSLRNMKNLEILSLKATNIFELPEELVTLCALKSLHFSSSGEQQVNFPPSLLSRLTSLQELHVKCDNNVNSSELKSLRGLTALSLDVSTHQCFLENFVFPKLRRYVISVNGTVGFLEGLTIRTLRIVNFSSSFNSFKELFCNVETLVLSEVREHKNIVPSIDKKGLNELIFLQLKYCKDMEYLMDTRGEKGLTTAFSNLERLYIDGMDCLKELWHGPPPIMCLQQLKGVYIFNCKKLISIFPTGFAQNLLHLHELHISGCNGLENIFDFHQEVGELEVSVLSNLSTLKLESLQELKRIWKGPTDLVNLQNLKTMKISHCHELAYLFDFSHGMTELEVPIPSLSNLTSMELDDLQKLKWIWKGPTHLVNLQSLKTMSIWRCLNLAYLFTTTLAQGLVHLEVLQLDDCNSLKHVIIEEAENDQDEMAPNLNGYCLHWPKLKTLQIRRCNSLKYVLPITLTQRHLNLEFVEIIDCSKLKHIFNVTNVKSGHEKQENLLQRLKILRLQDLENLISCCPKNFAMSIPSLEKLEVHNCSRLTKLVVTTLHADLKDVALNDSKAWLCDAKNVTLDRVEYRKNLSATFDPEKLTSLTLENGQGLQCLIDATYEGHVSTGACRFSNLVELVIENMTGFRMLCNGPFPKGSLQNLKRMKVEFCGQLQEVFQTKDLLLDAEGNQAQMLSNLTSLKLRSLRKLELIWKGPSHNVSLQSLKVAEISYCNRLKYLFSPSLALSLVQLEQLKIVHCDGLETIIAELEIDDSIESEGCHLHRPHLPKLTTLKIKECPRLKYVFRIPFSQQGLPQLKILSIVDSRQLKQVFNVAKEKTGVYHVLALPRLEELRLVRLISLTCLCSENYPIVSPSLKILAVNNCLPLSNFTMQKEDNDQVQLEVLSLSDVGFVELLCIHQLQVTSQVGSLQYLTGLNVSHCNRLKFLFSSMLARNLPQLKSLRIDSCEELEQFIEMDDQTSMASTSLGHLQPAISFPCLTHIWTEGCSNLKSLFPISVACSLSNIVSIHIHEAPKLEQVFGYQGELKVENDQKGIAFPKLETLELRKLPSIKSFAPMDYHFRFSSLIQLNVERCPNSTTRFTKDSENIVHAITETLDQAFFPQSEPSIWGF
ncbi:hypothetical protein PTKIN_Ptkin14bG0046700 [Pterospermum kingtungense]